MEAKKKQIQEAHDYEKFKSGFNDSHNWLENKKQEAESFQTPKDVAQVQKMLRRNEELKADFESYDQLQQLEDAAQKLIDNGHPQKDSIEQMLNTLKNEKVEVGRAIDLKKKKLEDQYSLMNFNRDAEEIEDWLDEVENVLKRDDNPETLEAAQELINKIESLEDEIEIEGRKVKSLTDTANGLINEDHSEKEVIKNRKDQIVDRYNNLGDIISKKKSNLKDKEKLLLWNREANDLENWMLDKQKEVQDFDPSDSSSFNAKEQIRKQEELALELAGRKKKLDDLKKSAKDLEGDDADRIHQRIKELESLWETLNQENESLSSQIQESESYKQTERDFDDLEKWFKEVDTVLSSDDVGNDLPSVQTLLKKHTLVEADISSHGQLVDEILKKSDELIAANVSFLFFFFFFFLFSFSFFFFLFLFSFSFSFPLL